MGGSAVTRANVSPMPIASLYFLTVVTALVVMLAVATVQTIKKRRSRK